jgi:mortality factor 4-like protein 1
LFIFPAVLLHVLQVLWVAFLREATCLAQLPHSAASFALQVLSGGRVPSSIYGAEHLLRLFIKLPELLPQAGTTGDQQLQLARRLEDVLAYLQHNQQELFLPRDGYVSPASAW